MINIVYPIYPMKTFFTSPTKTIVKLEFAMRQLRTPTRKQGHLLGSPGMISCHQGGKAQTQQESLGQDGN